MHLIEESAELLMGELERVGFEQLPYDYDKAWKAYQKFAEMEFDCIADDILWETGMDELDGERLFRASLIRQFRVLEEDACFQLYFTWYFEPDSILETLTDALWSYHYESVTDFFLNVEHRDSFILPPVYGDLIRYEIYLDEI